MVSTLNDKIKNVIKTQFSLPIISYEESYETIKKSGIITNLLPKYEKAEMPLLEFYGGNYFSSILTENFVLENTRPKIGINLQIISEILRKNGYKEVVFYDMNSSISSYVFIRNKLYKLDFNGSDKWWEMVNEILNREGEQRRFVYPFIGRYDYVFGDPIKVNELKLVIKQLMSPNN